MPSAIDITGKKYGRLTAIRIDKTSGRRLWLFRCDCGNDIITNSGYVKQGSVRSCGCLRKETTSARRSIDISGMKSGRLLVIDAIPERNKHGHIVWRCLCDCGKATTATTHAIIKNLKQSCGCIRREQMRALGLLCKKENPVSRTPEYLSAYRKKRREQPERAMAERVSRLMAWALSSVGAIKRSATFDLLGYTPAQLKVHIEKQFLPGMSWNNRNKWEIDHITPISKATCEADVIALNQLSNLRPLWAIDNSRKGNRLERLI